MQKNLVIVESPAKAKTIEKFLGSDFKVMSSYGHIRDLKKKDFGVNLKTFEPQYEIPADKKHVVSELRAQAKKAETIWLASDEDREGEAISWHLAEVLGLDPKETKRIVFHEITKSAIQNAIENPRHIDLHLVDAQQARRVLDRLVGFKLSPVLWRKVRPSLSAGRVQSVAVRLIVEREREINAFNATPYYRVTAAFLTAAQHAALPEAELDTRFADEKSATDFLEACRNAAFQVEKVVQKPVTRTPAPPFTTSTLQQEAARKLGFPVAVTMRVAQTLYEAGLITYMRTDSMNLSDFCKKSCEEVIKETMGADYHKRRAYHTHAKGAQEAHEAIRPTDMHRTDIEGTTQERRLYELIRKRTLACQMADAELEKTTATIAVGGRNEKFTAEGEVVKFDGFLRVYRESRGDEDTEIANDSAQGLLPAIAEGDALQLKTMKARQRFTPAPPRYSEASLVHKLEELGIGRPSTYAPTISTIQQREYVKKGDTEGSPRPYREIILKDGNLTAADLTENTGGNRGKLVPTDTGSVVNDFLMEYFPEIMDYHFTANVEKDFDEVAEGKMNWTKLISDFYNQLEPVVERTMKERTDHKAGERLLGTNPADGKPVSVKIGRYGPLVQIGTPEDKEKPRFANLAPGQSIETITLEEALELFKLPRTLGEHEGQTVKANSGRFGPYVQLGKLFASIPKGEDPMTIDLPRALELLTAKKDAEAKSHLKTFEEDKELEVRTGRFGPYISWKGKNFKLPKKEATRAAELTYEECLAIVKAESQKKKK
ncbi:MAG: type I DNA topoisomerase [Bacteroidales bacterium]|nr:type I DNA topoisomerase [Bacteroidales bacterium]MDD6554124.1 type I DNA topoisomerase [Bacteroidales bacterium]MDD6774299.1 type I DNA topoisomerase [Bacteroidales bacterium]